MILSELLRELRRLEMPVKTVGKDLLVKKGVLSEEYMKAIESYKAEIIAYLRNTGDTLTVFSRLLDRAVRVSWSGDDPQIVYVDFVPYQRDEIRHLKNVGRATVRNIHQLKNEFDGKIVTGKGDSHG